MKRRHNLKKQKFQIPLEKINDLMWRIPQSYKPEMKVPGIILADQTLLQEIRKGYTLEQCINVAHLPGIYKNAITLPDGHEGYGFPIGGVAATDYEKGVISPGGVGYDINCGVRLLVTNITENELKTKLFDLTKVMFHKVPSGLGSRRKDFRVTIRELNELITEGAQWLIDRGLGRPEDVQHIEEKGCMKESNSDKVSDRAKIRGLKQVGTLGSGNHFLEIQKVDKIYDPRVAKVFGITEKGQVTAMIHTGSRGFGHQVCSDYLRIMERAIHKYKIPLPDRQLACAPGISPEGEDYYQAMACAVNYAYANRQAITYWVRKSFQEVLKKSEDEIGLQIVYDIAHNIAKKEEHIIDGKRTTVFVHRKGATRAFPPGHKDVPAKYRQVGQPVLIPGSMGTSSWVLSGAQGSMDLTFGSTAHGAGRRMSRSAARRMFSGSMIKARLRDRGIAVCAASQMVLAEEADPAYKDVDRVVDVSHKLNIATKVCRLVPLGVVKG